MTFGGIARPTFSPGTRSTTTPTRRPLSLMTGPPLFPPRSPSRRTGSVPGGPESVRRNALMLIALTVTAGLKLVSLAPIRPALAGKPSE